MITTGRSFARARAPGHWGRQVLALCASVFAAGLLLVSSPALRAQTGVTLDGISYSTLPGDQVQVRLDLSAPVSDPLSFATENPARIALDFPGVSLNLPRRSQNIGVGMARTVAAAEAGGRTRVVLNLVRLVPYTLTTQGSSVFVRLDSAGATPAPVTTMAAGEGDRIQNIDFRRGKAGAGSIIVTLSNPKTVVNTREQGDKIIAEFVAVDLPQNLSRRLDVVDFGTPVQIVDTVGRGRNVRMEIAASGNFDHLAYQSDNVFTIEVKPLTKEEEEQLEKDRFTYTGERLSLNFQDIEVRAVLQLIADFTGLNLVASDSVGGNLTLRLKNVPWDQALDLILQSKDLAMRQNGNVLRVAPREEIETQERLELESAKQIEELEPLRTEYVQVNYAKASEIAELLKSSAGAEAGGGNLMSDRGSAVFDDRTNTLLLRDTAKNLASIRQLIATLDIPVRQVMIESRIVIADDRFSRDLGVKFGFSDREIVGRDYTSFLGGGLPGDTTFSTIGPDGEAVDTPTTFNEDSVENFIVDLPVAGPAGALKFAIGKIGKRLLQLELQALQVEGRGEVLSNPRVITSNQQEAVIEQGTEIPFQEASSSGATSVSFKKAVLALKVTPQITPDSRIIMDLDVSQDTVGQLFGGIPSIDTRNVNTQVLVDDGETVVLGGIYEQTRRKDVDKVPFFGDLPGVGALFRRTQKQDEKTELLIFVTPKILDEQVSLR